MEVNCRCNMFEAHGEKLGFSGHILQDRTCYMGRHSYQSICKEEAMDKSNNFLNRAHNWLNHSDDLLNAIN